LRKNKKESSPAIMSSDRQDYTNTLKEQVGGASAPKFELDLSLANSQSNILLLREQLRNMMGESSDNEGQ
jgi:hypothetical protein